MCLPAPLGRSNRRLRWSPKVLSGSGAPEQPLPDAPECKALCLIGRPNVRYAVRFWAVSTASTANAWSTSARCSARCTFKYPAAGEAE